MNLRYPTIRAKAIPEKYGVTGYPTLVVVDMEGKVREVHSGYSPRIYDDLSELIRALLAKSRRSDPPSMNRRCNGRAYCTAGRSRSR